MEIVFEIVFELIFELFFYIYYKLMSLIIPNYGIDKAKRKKA